MTKKSKGPSLAQIAHIEAISVLVEAFFFGVYSAIFIFSTIVLCRRSPSRARHAMLALSVVMYAASAAHLALFISRIEVFLADPSARVDVKDWAVVYLPSINYILSDVIVLWRAWVLWNRRLLLFVPPLVFILCNIGTTVAGAVLYYEAVQAPKSVLKTFNTTLYLQWTVWFLTFTTNLWATGLIFIRAWQHRRFLRSLRVKQTLTSNTEHVLAFLVESGALYLCIWITVIVTSVPQVMFAAESLRPSIAQFVGMYPTMFVIVVALRLSTEDVLSRPGAEGNSLIVFTSPSSSPAQPQLVEDIEKSLDGRSTPAFSDAAST